MNYKDNRWSIDAEAPIILGDEGHSTEDVANAPQDCHGQWKQGRSKTFSRPEKTKNIPIIVS